MSLHTQFKRILIVFWGLWWLIACWTDIIGGVAHLGIVRASWAPDNNYPFLVKSLQMYNVPVWLPAFLYILIIIFSTISVVLFARAIFAYRKPDWLIKANLAFIFSLTYWLLFFLADQLIMNFDLEQNHMVQGGFELMCYLVINLMAKE